MNIAQLPNGNYQIESLTTKGKFYQVNLQDHRCNCPHWVKINKGHNDKPISCKHIPLVAAMRERVAVNRSVDLWLIMVRFAKTRGWQPMVLGD